jgi:DNA-binding transcriptional LysR family regulator
MKDPVETAGFAFTRIVEQVTVARPRELGVRHGRTAARSAGKAARVRLLRRTTRRLALTDAGDMFYRHARIVLDAVGQAQASVRAPDDVMRGDLRVSVPPIIDESFLTMIAAFAKDHPEVRVQVDFSTRIVDLLREGYDVALRASSEIQPGLVARTVIRDKVIAVASPRTSRRTGLPQFRPRIFRNHRCLTGFVRACERATAITGRWGEEAWCTSRGHFLRTISGFASRRDGGAKGSGCAASGAVRAGNRRRGALRVAAESSGPDGCRRYSGHSRGALGAHLAAAGVTGEFARTTTGGSRRVRSSELRGCIRRAELRELRHPVRQRCSFSPELHVWDAARARLTAFLPWRARRTLDVRRAFSAGAELSAKALPDAPFNVRAPDPRPASHPQADHASPVATRSAESIARSKSTPQAKAALR